MIKDFLKQLFKTALELLTFGLIVVIVVLVGYVGAEFVYHIWH